MSLVVAVVVLIATTHLHLVDMVEVDGEELLLLQQWHHILVHQYQELVALDLVEEEVHSVTHTLVVKVDRVLF